MTEGTFNLDNELVPISYDLVLRLRSEGRDDDASNVLEQFRYSCEKQWKTDSRYLTNRDMRKVRFKCKIRGVCSENSCSNPVDPGHSRCKEHLAKHREYRKKTKTRV